MARRSDFSQALYKARTDLGLTLLQAAELITVSRNTVAQWESGAAIPGPAMLVAICAAYPQLVRADLERQRKRARASRNRHRRRRVGNGVGS